MKESIYTYFDVGTVLWMSYPPDACPEGGAEPLLKILRDDFFTCVEITQEETTRPGGASGTSWPSPT